jgi:hypothetical protein
MDSWLRIEGRPIGGTEVIRFLEGTDEDGLGIPYPLSEDSDSRNVGYLDLKVTPSNIDLVYELDDWPEFKGLVRLLNNQESFFRTLRCDVWFANVTGHAVFQKLAVGYLTLAFEILEYNCSKNCFDELRKRFLKFAPQALGWPESTIHFKHIPTSYNNHGLARAWSEDIEIHGFGRVEADARVALLRGLNPVGQFLLQESLSYPEELKKGRTTL